MTEQEGYMAQALALAREAAAAGEVPVGCVIVRGGEIVGRGRNRREEKQSAGAILNARIPRVYYGARDRAMGACGGVLNLYMEPFAGTPALVGGILADECRAVLEDFFRAGRADKLP